MQKKKRQRGPWDKRLGQRQERKELVRGLMGKATGQVGLELTVLLLQSPKCWDYRYPTRPGLYSHSVAHAKQELHSQSPSERKVVMTNSKHKTRQLKHWAKPFRGPSEQKGERQKRRWAACWVRRHYAWRT